MLIDEEIEKLMKAGSILRAVRGKIPRLVAEGVNIAEICEAVEGEIRKLGGEPAFPCNVGIDSVAAHYTSPPGEMGTVPAGALVKVDFGAHLDGYVADTAITVSTGSIYDGMIKVAEEALEKGLQCVVVGGKIADVGAAVERVIKGRGFKPISNLTGHQVSRYTIHAGVSIPNVTGGMTGGRFEPWSVYALEPFVTLPDAKGFVTNRAPGNILHIVKLKGPKEGLARGFFREAFKRYRTLPFAKRWVAGMGEAWRDLLDQRILYEYPVLAEASGKPVAQAEHTVVTTEKEVLVST
jgi:methionyl aminopeptidase